MTIRTLLENTVQKMPEAVALRFHHDGVWISRTYREFYGRIRQVAEMAGRMNLTPGSDQVALLLENGPEWVEIYAALAGTGITVVPIDPKLRPQEIVYILADAGAVAIFVGGRHAAVMEQILPQLPCLRNLVFVEEETVARTTCAGRPCHDYEGALTSAASAAAKAGAWFDMHQPVAESVASIIYTSGTTGKPKGAMLTHGNFCADVEGSLRIISDVSSRDNFLVLLPLFHAFSFTANFLMPVCCGSCMSFGQGLRTIGEDMLVLQPTVFMAVPLLVEKMYDRISGKIKASRLTRLLLGCGLGFVVRAQVRKSLGGRLRLLMVGGAPSSVRILEGCRRMGLNIIEGYGLTEAAPVVSLSSLKEIRPGTIGHKLPNIEVRIASPNEQGVGELQVCGPIVMKGYYHNEAATAAAFDGPWLRTGDLASMDADGFITIRGRCKALIVNREGKNIYPEEVEQCIARNPVVLDVVVVGYQEKGETGEKVGAILAPNRDVIRAQHKGEEPPWPAIEALLRQAVQEQCRDLADYKHPRKIEVRRDPLERTSTQKIRRVAYQGQLDEK